MQFELKQKTVNILNLLE